MVVPRKKKEIYLTILSTIVLVALGTYGVYVHQQKERVFERFNQKTAALSATSSDRVAAAVITLPNSTTLVDLVNGNKEYVADGMAQKSTINLLSKQMVTRFISGIFEKKDPRLDVVVPMYVSTGPLQGSMYVVLFWDRGDAAIERSYMRLGGADVVIDSVDTLPPDTAFPLQEYRVFVSYRLQGQDQKTNQIVSIPKEAIVPVVDGHFDPQHAVTK